MSVQYHMGSSLHWVEKMGYWSPTVQWVPKVHFTRYSTPTYSLCDKRHAPAQVLYMGKKRWQSRPNFRWQVQYSICMGEVQGPYKKQNTCSRLWDLWTSSNLLVHDLHDASCRSWTQLNSEWHCPVELQGRLHSIHMARPGMGSFTSWCVMLASGSGSVHDGELVRLFGSATVQTAH